LKFMQLMSKAKQMALGDPANAVAWREASRL
jgi:hypothetical protein